MAFNSPVWFNVVFEQRPQSSACYINSVEDIRRTVLKTREGTPVMVGDVAEIVQSNTPRRGAVGWNEQKEAVEGFALMRRGENPSRVLAGVHAKV